jgi:hypothetical protein
MDCQTGFWAQALAEALEQPDPAAMAALCSRAEEFAAGRRALDAGSAERLELLAGVAESLRRGIGRGAAGRAHRALLNHLAGGCAPRHTAVM